MNTLLASLQDRINLLLSMLSAPDVPSSTPKHQLVGLAIRWCISHKLAHVVRHSFLPATLNTAE
eukprot:11631217-Karenia_brevis.AAC.1